MYTISAFADEISPNPEEQVDVLAKSNVRYIELRSILKTNVLDLTDHQIAELKSLLDARGFGLSAIGSPIGKVKVDADFDAHFKRFERAVDLAQRFETSNIRIFSFYPPGDAHDWNGVEERWEKEAFSRLQRLADRADQAGLTLMHENEHRIYGDSPDRVVKLFASVHSPSFKAVYDAANYVFCGYDPWEGWTRTKHLTAHFHIKDWKKGEDHGSLAGEGDGRWPDVIADAKDYVGYATMEPHLLGGGPTGGVTGPELFPRAIAAFRGIMAHAGVKEG